MVPPARPFISIFERVPDPRQAKGRRHPLAAVLTIVVLALINQQNTLRQIAAWAQGLGEQIRSRLPLHRNRIPSEATIRRVLRNLDVEALTQAVQDWVEEVLTAYFPTAHWQGLAIDGKTLRRSQDEDLPALQVLHAMVHELGAFIRSQAIPAGRNELGAISPFLGEVVLEGRVVTLDALLTHRDIAQAILERGGHYLMRVKANQPQLLEDLKLWFDDPSPLSRAENRVYRRVIKGHGRLVCYTLRTTEALNAYLQRELGWPGVGQAFCIECRYTKLRSGERGIKVHYGITSLDFRQATPEMVLDLWHRHWDIENQGHWVLDVVFGEDQSRARKVHLPQTLSLLRRAVITLLRLFGQEGVTCTRARLSANVDRALSLIGLC